MCWAILVGDIYAMVTQDPEELFVCMCMYELMHMLMPGLFRVGSRICARSYYIMHVLTMIHFSA